jgi:hypothetical protein
VDREVFESNAAGSSPARSATSLQRRSLFRSRWPIGETRPKCWKKRDDGKLAWLIVPNLAAGPIPAESYTTLRAVSKERQKLRTNLRVYVVNSKGLVIAKLDVAGSNPVSRSRINNLAALKKPILHNTTLSASRRFPVGVLRVEMVGSGTGQSVVVTACSDRLKQPLCKPPPRWDS